MRGHSESNVFSPHEVTLWRRATSLVDLIPDMGDVLRCHELARAVGRVLALQVADGNYGSIDHSWCWTGPLGRTFARYGFPNILDVYSVGQLPLVRLVASEPPSLPHMGWAYRAKDPRVDIDEKLVNHLVSIMQG